MTNQVDPAIRIEEFFNDAIPDLEMPIIENRENCVTVGPFKVITNGDEYEVRRGRHLVKVFSRRGWATAYALRLYTGDAKSAQTLVNADETYRRLATERDEYLYHISSCQRKENWTRSAIFMNRLSRVDSEIAGLAERISPILKYCRM